MELTRHHRPWYWIAIWMIAAGASAESAGIDDEFPIQPHRAEYRVLRGDSEIGLLEAELSQRDDDRWHYRIESEATAWYVRMLGISTTESAWFEWREQNILPLTYHHVSREPGSDRYWQHRFDWAAGFSETRTHDGTLRIPLRPATLDPLTLRLAASAAIHNQADDDRTGFQGFERPVLERDEIEVQQYLWQREESLLIDGRCYATQVFRRHRKPGSSRNYEAWHAAELGWLPVRVLHSDAGKPIVMELTAIESPHYRLPPKGPCQATKPPMR
jgi:hypothetical protein